MFFNFELNDKFEIENLSLLPEECETDHRDSYVYDIYN